MPKEVAPKKGFKIHRELIEPIGGAFMPIPEPVKRFFVRNRKIVAA